LSSYNSHPLPEGIVFNNGGDVYLNSYNSHPLPEGIVFNNGGDVYLNSYNSHPLPEGIVFNNGGDVYLNSYNSHPLPKDIVFNNGCDVYLSSYNSHPLPKDIVFNNGCDVYLSSYNSHPLPEGTTFNNGGDVYLGSEIKKIRTPYLKRFNVKVENGKVILYKKVSFDFKTQENTKNETLWLPGTTVEHPDWKPFKDECGAGKFHACSKPLWCDTFRNGRGDKYVSIEVDVSDLYEWTDSPTYPKKIGFRKGKVLSEVERY